MNQVTEEKKESLTKTLAIVGFVAMIIFAVWLAVQVVKIIPGAFSSLASIADVVYNYNDDEKLEVATSNSVVNAGESFTISWTDMRKDGTYVFSYECAEGVSVDVRDQNGQITPVSCGTDVVLGDTSSLEIRATSEKDRFVDLAYTLTYTETGEEEGTTAASTVTIVNASIPVTGLVQEDEEEEPEETPTNTPTPAPAAKPVTKTPTYVAGTPTTVTKYVYVTPVSDPKGDIDLAVRFLGVGTLSGKTFTPRTSIDADDNGALQFEVKNVGTKTAEDWSYEAELPADISYTSGDQKALKPNERAVITLGFEGITKTGTEKIEVEVTAKNDVKRSNNDFETTVKIVD